ncbi:MAG: HD domain-containing phosphohydrolase [Candidatus Omnitrophota bacterium]
MFNNPTNTIDELITAISYIIDIENDKNYYHAWRVAILASNFAKYNTKQELKDIFYASLLHDIGAIGLTKHIIHFLEKESRLKQNALLSHPIIGAQQVSIIPNFNPSAKLILDHHEWFNGMGYPRGRLVSNILYGSQLIRIADYIDILLRSTHNLKNIIREINKNTGKQFSKKVSNLAIKIIKKEGFLRNISDHNRIPLIFYNLKSKVGKIIIKKGVDAVGTTLEVLAQIIDMKHPFTAGHSLRVSRYALAIALSMKLDHDQTTSIKWAGLLHDIGKITTPRSILEKTTPLTSAEFIKIKQHPIVTQKIMDMIPSLAEIVPSAVGHHEYYDGSGYPFGLKGDQSPLGARILTVCDAFDAMTSNRPYREPLNCKAACREIRRNSGKQFDPGIVKYALPIFKNLGL